MSVYPLYPFAYGSDAPRRLEIIHDGTIITEPAVEPIDLDEVKRQLRFPNTSEDTHIDRWISAARRYFENQCDRQLIEAVREQWMPCAPVEHEIELHYPPLLEVVSVTYWDGSAFATMDSDDYTVIAPAGAYCRRGRISIGTGASWPSITTGGRSDALKIRYRCGYGPSPAHVPEDIKAALFWLVGHFHKFRHEVQEVDAGRSLTRIPLSAADIIRDYKYSARPQISCTRAPW